ncbi:hypothetical protein KKG41_00020 [Patescibacteria group bacterium]|nr:hypothetical protein [Patescibacteria group bacterium]
MTKALELYPPSLCQREVIGYFLDFGGFFTVAKESAQANYLLSPYCFNNWFFVKKKPP